MSGEVAICDRCTPASSGRFGKCDRGTHLMGARSSFTLGAPDLVDANLKGKPRAFLSQGASNNYLKVD